MNVLSVKVNVANYLCLFLGDIFAVSFSFSIMAKSYCKVTSSKRSIHQMAFPCSAPG